MLVCFDQRQVICYIVRNVLSGPKLLRYQSKVKWITQKNQGYNVGDEVTIGIRRGDEFSRVKVILAAVRSVQQAAARR